MYIFAYGLVASNRTENLLLTRGLHLVADRAWVQGTLLDTGLGFPALTRGDDKVSGKLYLADAEAVPTLLQFAKRCDELNPPYQFVLTPITVVTPIGNYHANTFTYEFADGLEKIPGGIWN